MPIKNDPWQPCLQADSRPTVEVTRSIYFTGIGFKPQQVHQLSFFQNFHDSRYFLSAALCLSLFQRIITNVEDDAV